MYKNIDWKPEGSILARLYNSNLEGLKVTFPIIDEQQKIATFLSAVNKKIDLIKKQIEKTQTFKKGLLQQMFV